MAAIDDLVAQISDERLRGRIQDELKKLSQQKKFGLVFEEHLPECTPLYDVPVKRGSQVALKTGKIDDVYKVIDIVDGKALCLSNVGKEASFDVSDLVCVAQFGEPIYPYLKPIDTVCNAPDSSLWHTVIEAENYHALQLRQSGHRFKRLDMAKGMIRQKVLGAFNNEELDHLFDEFGVFEQYSQTAREEASCSGKKRMDLIDGEAFIDKLAQYGLGLTPAEAYDVNEEFFQKI